MTHYEAGQFVLGRGQKQFDVRVVNSFYDDVSNGKVPGWRRWGFAGYNPTAIQDVEETLWAIGGKRTIPDEIPFDAYLSSTDPDDDASIFIIGLGEDGRLTFRVGVLNGQNQVKIGGGKMLRVMIQDVFGNGSFKGANYIAKKDDAPGGVPAFSKILSAALPNTAFSWNGFITIPTGCTSKFLDVFITPNKDQVAEIFMGNKYTFEEKWHYPPPFETGQNFAFRPSVTFDELSEVEFSVIARDTGVKATVYVDTILIDNNYL